MTDETKTPEQQAQAPDQPDPSPPEGFVEQARFNGLMQRNEALTAQLETTNGNLAARSSELEQLNQRIAEMEVSQTEQVNETKQTVAQLNEQVSTLTTASAEHESLKLKLKVANEMGRPDLMALAQHIPNSTDEAEIKEALTAFAGFSDGAVQKREAQLLSGTSPTGGGGGQAPAMPTTPEGWANYVNSFTLGTPEREAALKAYGKAVNEQINQ